MPARRTLLPQQLASLALLLLCCVATQLPAQTQAELHAAEAPLAGTGERALAAAFAEALGSVLVKVTGRRDADRDPQLRQAVGDPAALVQQYRPAGAGRVRVQFDPVALRRRLDALDLPIWVETRPTTLVWIVAPDADGQPELVEPARLPPTNSPGTAPAPAIPPAGVPDEPAGDASLPAPLGLRVATVLAEVGAARGIALVQPLLDFQDLAMVNAAGLAAGQFDALPDAARRYAAEAVLVGRADSMAADNLRWTLLSGDEEIEWVGDLAEGPHGLADRLGQRLASARSGLQLLRLLVGEVGSLDAWGRLNTYLASLGIIETYQVERVSGDSMLLALEVRGDAERLVRTLALGRVLEPLPAAGEGGDLAYRLTGWP